MILMKPQGCILWVLVAVIIFFGQVTLSHDNYIILMPFPDVSHIVDSKQIARAISIMNITSQPDHLFIINTSDERQVVDQNNQNYSMINIKDYSPYHNAIKGNLIERVRALVSDSQMTDRYQAMVGYYFDIYEPTIRGLDELFETHPQLSTIDPSKLFFVIDGIYSPAIEWSRKRGIRHITLANTLILIPHQYKPNIFPRMIYERTSLRRGREILENEGILKFFMNRIEEKLLRFFDFLRNVISLSNRLNEVRKNLGYESVMGPFVDSSDRASIYFSLPGFDYATPLPVNYHLVGFTNTIVDNTKLNERDEIVDGWMERSNANQIIYLSFGTKARLSINHTCDFIRNILSINSTYNILISERINTWSDFEKCRGILPEWKNQVLVRPWLNQAKVLSNPKVKIFISHGGAHSLFESIENQVPIMLFPQFAEQFLNNIRAEDLGFGRAIYDPANSVEFTKLYNELMENTKIKTNLKKWDKINQFHTQHFTQLAQHNQISPNLLMAANVIENIIENGDEHLRSTEKQLYFIETIDIVHLLLLLLVLPLLLFLSKRFLLRRS
ncbi:predicted protein [Naegleria gruberi]|uniref:Predicted protein n=1 Tax=Naegleria gruberi TaxID=5762 RepID=D2V1U1_NAEGR|nr:uncharacterized protein NAEGRDRAFT_62695 [Naegleria gruberi]EFC49219.1 predicted protein [Naegleria gruberi]|eukprot:XP_002681963.1 predicted protein [Naegleria gruberi strain NEG-M]